MFVLGALFSVLFIGIPPNVFSWGILVNIVVALIFVFMMGIFSAFTPVFTNRQLLPTIVGTSLLGVLAIVIGVLWGGYLKFVMQPKHMVSLGGYIVETQFPYRNLIVINKTSEPIKIEIPVFDESWIEEHRELGLEVIPVSKEDNYLKMWKRAHAELDKIRN